MYEFRQNTVFYVKQALAFAKPAAIRLKMDGFQSETTVGKLRTCTFQKLSARELPPTPNSRVFYSSL